MSQDNKKSFVMYQGDGSNNVFSVPMTKGKYGTISVAFVRRGLDQYEYNPDTWGLNGGLFAWDLSGTKVYTDTAAPAIGATIYDQYGVDTGDTVTAVGGATITVNTNVYTRDTLHDVDENTVLTWTGTTLEVGDYIVIERTTTRTQPFEFQNNQKHIEKSDDNLERQIQEVADKVDNALLVDPTHTIDSNKMNPVEWMKTILRSVDKSVRGFRYLNGWLDYSLDDPNIADVDKTWTHLVNTDNIKAIREQSRIEDGETIYWTEYLAQDGSWKILSRGDMIKLSDLADTDFTNLSAGNFIMFDGLKWKNVYSSATASWGTLLGNIDDQIDLKARLDGKLSLDGSSTMTGVLKMRASESFKCAIAPSWDGVGFFKLNDNDSVTLIASMEEIDGLTPATNNKYNIGKSAYKWKDLYLSGKAYMSVINNGYDIAVPTTSGTMALLSDVAFKSTDVEFTSLAAGQFLRYDGTKWINSSDSYANTNLNNLTSTGKNISNWSSNVSNCITEIPQDIKLELNNGTLTLKAGSKVYVPNGAGVFDEVIVQNNITTDSTLGTITGDWFLFYNNGGYGWELVSHCYSGDALPTGYDENRIGYNTSTNKMMRSESGGAYTELTNYSFPVCQFSTVNGTITSINQVFNGFGYIGSTVFALPGVKCLIPDGRNSDGSLKNVEYTIPSVKTYTSNVNQLGRYLIGNDGNIYWIAVESEYYEQATMPFTPAVNKYGLWYNPDTNIMLRSWNNEPWTKCSWTTFAKVNGSSNKITSLKPKTVFRAADLNDLDVDYVVETYTSGSPYYSWYRRYKSGWVEQGGYLPATSGGDNLWTVVFPKPMADTHYTTMISQTDSTSGNSTTWNTTTIQQQSTTGFKAITGYDWGRYWYVCGMAA